MLARCTNTHARSFATCTSAGAFEFRSPRTKFGRVSTSNPTNASSAHSGVRDETVREERAFGVVDVVGDDHGGG